MEHDQELDATGLLCPLPVLKLRKRLQALAPGQLLLVWADDPVAAIDIPAFCKEAGHEVLQQAQVGTRQRYVVRRG